MHNYFENDWHLKKRPYFMEIHDGSPSSNILRIQKTQSRVKVYVSFRSTQRKLSSKNPKGCKSVVLQRGEIKYQFCYYKSVIFGM